ncbi:hypothetical protein LC087_09435 [Bacillus carboniphilus]|uniref:Uncharacterized protein n=1 Tax=Bacillus carboniphilus TaxID=86663 RepID=A0ABY9JU26_9BACI|nr:hypothetical protein [Bacillus carboniphilus]WLR41191.1 hypothetical protein LC087_09435 [Bacillus carboniphilus]
MSIEETINDAVRFEMSGFNDTEYFLTLHSSLHLWDDDFTNYYSLPKEVQQLIRTKEYSVL